MEEIAILIPCYNEEKTIGQVIRELKRELPEAKIYVGDNNSTDNTKIIAQKEKVEVIEEKQKGKARMVRKMLQEIEAEYYILVDGDNECYAKDTKKILEIAMQQKADLVIGTRCNYNNTSSKKKIYKMGNKLANKIINAKYKTNVEDIMSGMRVLSKKLVKNINIKSKGFELETEITVFAIKENYIIIQVPIRYRNRPKGSKSKLRTIRDGLKISLAVLRS